MGPRPRAPTAASRDAPLSFSSRWFVTSVKFLHLEAAAECRIAMRRAGVRWKSSELCNCERNGMRRHRAPAAFPTRIGRPSTSPPRSLIPGSRRHTRNRRKAILPGRGHKVQTQPEWLAHRPRRGKARCRSAQETETTRHLAQRGSAAADLCRGCDAEDGHPASVTRALSAGAASAVPTRRVILACFRRRAQRCC